MNRLTLIAVVALLGLAAFVVGDLLDPETVPVAEAVELTGTAPEEGPARDGFFIVPPPVVDFRERSDDSASVGDDADDDDADSLDDHLDDEGGSVDDDDADSLDDEDDSVDDDD